MTEFNINIKNLKFESMEVGRLIKSSKYIYTWEMTLDDVRRKIELIHSRITGKRKIILDGKMIVQAQKYTYEFTYTFPISNHYLNVIQIAPDLYELKIDNITFTTLTNRENKEKVKKLKTEQNKKIETLNKSEKVEHKKSSKEKIDEDFFQNKFSDNFENQREIEKPQKKKKKTNDDFFDKQGDWDFDFDNNENKITKPKENSSNFDFIQGNKIQSETRTGFNFDDSQNKFSNNFPSTSNSKTNNINLINLSEDKPSANNLIDMNDIFSGNKPISNNLSSNADNKLIDFNFNLNDDTKNSNVINLFNDQVN